MSVSQCWHCVRVEQRTPLAYAGTCARQTSRGQMWNQGSQSKTLRDKKSGNFGEWRSVPGINQAIFAGLQNRNKQGIRVRGIDLPFRVVRFHARICDAHGAVSVLGIKMATCVVAMTYHRRVRLRSSRIASCPGSRSARTSCLGNRRNARVDACATEQQSSKASAWGGAYCNLKTHTEQCLRCQ